MGELLDKINSSQDVKKLNIAEMNALAQELREYILEVIAENGGHLAPNLGVIELTIAMHKFLDLPNDEIVWDVGHQCYAHKILTGRKEEFRTIRQFQGLSGFPKPRESEYDAFVSGHSSTSVSVAVGLSQASLHNNADKKVFAVIGDGALSGGMVYEALNHGGDLKKPFTVILNDNEMSIAENVGAMSGYLTRLRTNKRYNKLKERITHRLLKMPKYGKFFYSSLERIRDSIKYFLVQGIFFEEMGFVYLGPVDGHDIASMIETFTKASQINKPTLIHVITKKGKGYPPAELNPTQFHGTSPFNLATGMARSAKAKTFTSYFASQMLVEAENDQKVIAITAAMPDGTGLSEFSKKYPERFYDVGIAEPHALTFAGALAARGLKPVVALYSTFLQRGYDQVFHDIALPNSPVVLAIDRAGLVGEDGETHQGIFDLAILRQMPNMSILAPRDGANLKQMLSYALQLNQPVAIRYSKGQADNLLDYPSSDLELGKAQVLIDDVDCSIGILAVGSMVKIALETAEILKKQGIKVAVADLRFVKPIDEVLITAWAKKFGKIAVIEDGIKSGGASSACMEVLQASKIQAEVEPFALPVDFIKQGKVSQLMDYYGLTPDKIGAKIKEIWC